jgi:hypothetical protein
MGIKYECERDAIELTSKRPVTSNTNSDSHVLSLTAATILLGSSDRTARLSNIEKVAFSWSVADLFSRPL